MFLLIEIASTIEELKDEHDKLCMFVCFNSLFVVRFFGSKGGAAQNGKELFLVFQELF